MSFTVHVCTADRKAFAFIMSNIYKMHLIQNHELRFMVTYCCTWKAAASCSDCGIHCPSHKTYILYVCTLRWQIVRGAGAGRWTLSSTTEWPTSHNSFTALLTHRASTGLRHPHYTYLAKLRHSTVTITAHVRYNTHFSYWNFSMSYSPRTTSIHTASYTYCGWPTTRTRSGGLTSMTLTDSEWQRLCIHILPDIIHLSKHACGYTNS